MIEIRQFLRQLETTNCQWQAELIRKKWLNVHKRSAMFYLIEKHAHGCYHTQQLHGQLMICRELQVSEEDRVILSSHLL